jgi:hypothetical protein
MNPRAANPGGNFRGWFLASAASGMLLCVGGLPAAAHSAGPAAASVEASVRLPPASAAQQFRRLEELRSRYERENDPVRRARALARLGKEKMEVLRQVLSEARYDDAACAASTRR